MRLSTGSEMTVPTIIAVLVTLIESVGAQSVTQLPKVGNADFPVVATAINDRGEVAGISDLTAAIWDVEWRG